MSNTRNIVCLIFALILSYYTQSIEALPGVSRLQKRDGGSSQSYGNLEIVSALNEKANPAPNKVITSKVLSEVNSFSNSSVDWLTWSSASESSIFTSDGADKGLNYLGCGSSKALVGLRCQGKLCGKLSLFCATLKTKTSDVSFSQTGVPKVGDAKSIYEGAKTVGYVNDAINPNRRACPVNQAISGISCVKENCQFLGLHCGSPISSNSSIRVAMANPGAWDYYIPEKRSTMCTWESTTSSTSKDNVSNPAMCPKGKLIAGISATNKESSALQIYCCPVYQRLQEVPKSVAVEQSSLGSSKGNQSNSSSPKATSTKAAEPTATPTIALPSMEDLRSGKTNYTFTPNGKLWTSPSGLVLQEVDNRVYLSTKKN